MSRRVLLITAERGLIQDVERAFQGQGIALHVARDWVEAMLFLDRERCDVVLIEVKQAGGDELGLCEVIRRSWDVGIFLLYRDASAEEIVKAYEMGADGYVMLPFSDRELVARVDALARRVALEREQQSDQAKDRRAGRFGTVQSNG